MSNVPDKPWHYEYKPGGKLGPLRMGADSAEDAAEMIRLARERDPLISEAKIFEGGSIEFGSGKQHYGAGTDTVGEV